MVTDFGFTDDVADAVAIQPLDGKIVVAGDLAIRPAKLISPWPVITLTALLTRVLETTELSNMILAPMSWSLTLPCNQTV